MTGFGWNEAVLRAPNGVEKERSSNQRKLGKIKRLPSFSTVSALLADVSLYTELVQRLQMTQCSLTDSLGSFLFVFELIWISTLAPKMTQVQIFNISMKFCLHCCGCLLLLILYFSAEMADKSWYTCFDPPTTRNNSTDAERRMVEKTKEKITENHMQTKSSSERDQEKRI